MRTILISVMTLLVLSPVSAQKKKRVAKVVETPVEKTQEQINYENLLPSTAKLIFIDSTVTKIDGIIQSMPLSKPCGVLSVSKQGEYIKYSYTNELENKRYLSIPDNDGVHSLYVQDKYGRDWAEPEKLEIQGDLYDIICPVMQADGVTLSFAAKGGEDNLGDHDLFYTVYDSEENSFYKPQTLGLPFNSFSDDLYYVIDDFTGFGYLVTQRNQSEGEACVYTFVPTESRQAYEEGIDENKLRGLADLHSIADTQYDKDAYRKALAGYRALHATNAASADDAISFVVNGDITYRSPAEFKVAANRERYIEYLNKKAEIQQRENALLTWRSAYHNGDFSKADKIVQTERQLDQENEKLDNLLKTIRNEEIKALGKAK